MDWSTYCPYDKIEVIQARIDEARSAIKDEIKRANREGRPPMTGGLYYLWDTAAKELADRIAWERRVKEKGEYNA